MPSRVHRKVEPASVEPKVMSCGISRSTGMRAGGAVTMDVSGASVSRIVHS